MARGKRVTWHPRLVRIGGFETAGDSVTPREGAAAAGIYEHIITSRLLILQSKRLLVASAQRRATWNGSQRQDERVERLRSEAELASLAYHRTVLMIGSPDQPDYWTVAYGRLVQLGNELRDEMLETSRSLLPPMRDMIATDLDLLNDLVHDWTEAMRNMIAAA